MHNCVRNPGIHGSMITHIKSGTQRSCLMKAKQIKILFNDRNKRGVVCARITPFDINSLCLRDQGNIRARSCIPERDMKQQFYLSGRIKSPEIL